MTKMFVFIDSFRQWQLISQTRRNDYTNASFVQNQVKNLNKGKKFCTLPYKEIFIHMVKESFVFASKIFYRLIPPNKVWFRGSQT